MIKIGYRQCQVNHTLFVKRQGTKVTTLIVYVDDIFATRNEDGEITRLKDQLAQEFEIKDLGHLKYFLGIKVTKSTKGIFLSQMKYVLDLLKDASMTRCKPCSTPIEAYHRLKEDDNDKLIDAGRYEAWLNVLFIYPLLGQILRMLM